MPEVARDCHNRARGLTYYMHDESAAFRFQLAGELSREATADLDQARETASSVFGGRSLVADLTGLKSIDTAGRELLEKWHGLGAQLVVTTQEAKVRMQAMAGVPLGFLEKDAAGSGWPAGRAVVWLLAATFMFLSVATVIATDPERDGSSIPLMGQARWKH